MRLTAIFLPSLRGGGAERVMVTLARGLAERHLRVDLVLAKAEGPYLSHVPSDVRIVDLGASRVLTSLPGLIRYLQRERPAVLLSALDHTNVVALWARQLAKVPVRMVVSIHNTLSIASNQARYLREMTAPYWTRMFYPWADVVVAVSQGVADDFARSTGFPRSRIRVIYNPVITPELFRKAREPVEHPWFRSSETPTVLSVGRLTEQKDFATLIRAFARVRQKCLVRLVILGEGEKRPELERLVRKLNLEKDVSLPGFVENPYRYMRLATVFVLSSRWEGLPTVLIEALSLEVPVIATDCPSGPREILRNGELGYLIPVGDAQCLAETIGNVLREPRHCAVPGRKEWILENFSLDCVVQKYLEVLKAQC